MKSEKKVLTDSKPVKRTTKSSAAPKAATTKTAHRHSTLSVSATPVEAIAATGAGPSSTPAPEEVARLAHAFWVERNFAHGFAEEDWLRAEKTLSAAN
jgi:hypothetical protein